jgi:hypothetical protein
MTIKRSERRLNVDRDLLRKLKTAGAMLKVLYRRDPYSLSLSLSQTAAVAFLLGQSA